MRHTIVVKRVYDDVNDSDGVRILVDRLWPRGIKMSIANLDNWLKDVAPSTMLRKWFSHDPDNRNEFCQR